MELYALWILFYLFYCVQSADLCPDQCTCLGNIVDCSDRKLTKFIDNIPSWTETLFLQNNGFENFETEDFTNLPQVADLKTLDLSSCAIKNLPSGFQTRFPNLEDLNLKNNQLESVPSSVLNGLLKLRELQLRGNRIQNVTSDDLRALRGLLTVDLGKNVIEQWPSPAFGEQARLTELILDGNRISYLTQNSFDNLNELRTLKLGKNRLRSLTKGVFGSLSNLIQLDLSRNRIRELFGLTFSGLGKLRNLKLGRNGLKYLEDGTFWGLDKLKELNLKQNKLTGVSKGWTYGMKALLRLYLSENEIRQVDNASFSHLPNLLYLDLSGNKIQSILPWNFRPLSQLTELDLSNNQLEHMTNVSLAGLGKLEILNLEDNVLAPAFEDSHALFSGVPQLSTLNLAANGIRTVPDRAFTGLDHFTTLHLTDNPITSLTPASFNGLDQLNHLYMNSTSFVCDCQLDWLPDWMKLHHFDETNNQLKCGDLPTQLAGQNIYDIDVTKMTCENSPKPVIIEHPEDTTGLQQGDTSLQCTAVASPNSTVTAQWKRDDIVLYEDEDSLEILNSVVQREDGMVEYKSVLKIIDVVQADTANYQCIISNRFGAAYSKRAKLTVYVYPSFLKTPENLTLTVGQTARLVCAALGYPKPEIRWEKDGGHNHFPAATERRMHVMANDDVFFIVQLKPADAGTYTCKATNEAGQITASAVVTIKERPTLMKGMEDKRADAGTTVLMECLVAGQPKPLIKWYYNSSALVQTDRIHVEADSQILVVLHVTNADQGIYACEIENEFGVTREEAQLTVTGDLHDAKVGKPLPPGVVAVGGGTSNMFSHPGAVIGLIVVLVVVAVVLTSVVWVTVIYFRVKRANESECAESAGGSRAPYGGGHLCADEAKPLQTQSGRIGPCSPPLTLERDGRVWKQTSFPRNQHHPQPIVVYSGGSTTGDRGHKRPVYRVKDLDATRPEPMDWRGVPSAKMQTSSLDSGVLEEETSNSSPLLDDKVREETEFDSDTPPPPLPPRLDR